MRALNFFSFLFCFSFSAGPAASQEAPLPRRERIERARESIKALKGGALIVRLPSHQKKIDALKGILSSTGQDSPNRKRLEKQFKSTLADRQEFNQNIMMAFNEAYNFSEAYFILDTATASLKGGQFQGIFLDDSLQPDPAIRLAAPPPYFVLRFGSTSDMTTDGLEAMVITDGQFEDMDKPFPYYQRLNDFSAFMGSIFPAPDQKEKDALRIVSKLNKKLHEYYNQVLLAQGDGG